MGNPIINEKIVFLLPIDEQTKSCGIYGYCPDNIRNKLESMGLEVSIIFSEDAMKHVTRNCCVERSVGKSEAASKKLDLLLFLDIPSRRLERERLLAHIKSIRSDNWSFAALRDSQKVYGTSCFVRVLRSFDAFMFVSRGRSFAKSLEAGIVDTLTVVPCFESPGVVLDNEDPRPIAFMRDKFFNFLRPNNLISRIVLNLFIVTGCINYFIGRPMIVGKK